MAIVSPTSASETLSPNDFKHESWGKTIDFFDYARYWASAHGKTPPPANWSAFGNLDVTDAEIDVCNGAITTSADDGERIFEASFEPKETHNLYNYTASSTEANFDTYNAVTRTTGIAGYARNPIFSVHTALLRLVPLVVAHMRPALYQKARDHIMNMTRADYFYIVSYPTYSGFRVEHDPTYTTYIDTTGFPSENALSWQILLFAGVGAAAIVIIGVVFTVRRRSQKVPEISRTSEIIETP